MNLTLVVVYLTVCAAGITTSNLGIEVNRQDIYAAHPDTLGNTQDVRSDEYLVDTPLALWTLAAPGEAVVGEMSALSGWTMRIATGPAQQLIFLDRAILNLGHFIPAASAFALQWWLPHLLVILFLPSLFSQLGARRRYGYGAAALIILSPAQTWWSMQPSIILGPTIAGCVAMLAAHHRLRRGQWLLPGVQLLAGAVLLASMTSRYMVWVLLLGGAVLGATLAHILFDRSLWRTKLVTILGCGLASLSLTIAAVLESRSGLQTFLSTVYPGARRSSASAQNLPAVFGAPFLSELAHHDPIGTNASELSSSFNIVILLIALLLPLLPSVRAWLSQPAQVFLTIWCALWFLWGTVSLGSLGEHLPVLNMVPSYRAIQVVGFVGLILFFLMLSRLPPISRGWRLGASALVGWISLYAGSVLQESQLPKLATWVVWAGGLGVAVSTFAMLTWSRRFWPILLTTALAATISINSLPVQIGLGDFRETPLSNRLLELGEKARANNEVWASNSVTFDSLLVATGVPSLSGFQRSGPNRDQWLRLDPTEKRVDSWNRSAGYVRFNWVEGASIRISDNSFDVVWVTADPCRLAETIPELTRIASTRRLNSDCLTPAATYNWGKVRVTEYEVNR